MAPNPAEGVAGAAPRRAVCRRSNPTACALSVLRNEFFDNRPLGRYRLDLSVRLRRGGVLLAAVQAVAVVVVLTALFLAPLRSTEHQRTPADRSDRPTIALAGRPYCASSALRERGTGPQAPGSSAKRSFSVLRHWLSWCRCPRPTRYCPTIASIERSLPDRQVDKDVSATSGPSSSFVRRAGS